MRDIWDRLVMEVGLAVQEGYRLTGVHESRSGSAYAYLKRRKGYRMRAPKLAIRVADHYLPGRSWSPQGRWHDVREIVLDTR